jgi:hypothetical protein
MQATTIRTIQKPDRQFPEESSRSESHPAVAALLALAVSEAHAQGVYVYSFDPLALTARIVSWTGLPPADPPVPAAVTRHAARTHFGRSAPLVLHERAWSDPRFEPLPEFARNRFEGVASIPLLESGAVVGLMNVCRSRPVSLQASALSFLLSLSAAVSALLVGEAAKASLRREIDSLNRQLADRKLLERAKGLIQAQFEWSEEQAYLHLRNLSRRRRTPLREIAMEVIERFPGVEQAV